MLATRMRSMAAAGVTGTPAAGWWVVAGRTCVAAYQPIGAASLAASYVNLANPGTYDAAPGVAPTWASGTGWTFNGTNQYLTTGVVPADGWSMTIRVDAYNNTISRYFAGGGIYGALLRIGHTTTNFTYDNGLGSGVGSLLSAPAVCAVAGAAAYKNGISEGLTLGGWSGSNNQPIVIGARNYIGVVALYHLGTIQACAIYSDTLSGAEVATLSAAMAALT